jgi:phenylacetate-coenzyme A ligase PaaK-like adenylate-forming protein
MPIVEWLAATRRRGGTPFLSCFSSAAVLICQAALKKGIDISGSQLIPSGEPFTSAKRAITEAAGVTAISRYGAMEAGHAAYGCLDPVEPDETHIVSDLMAVVQRENVLTDQPAALYLTSLSPHAPSTLLNANLGDAGVLSSRRCGCPVERLGWDPHLHSIRSVEKLTAAGTTLLDIDIVRILEQDLPRAFGGSAVDYQVVEEELPDGRPKIRLLVSPGVADLDLADVGRVFREAIASTGGAEHLMMRVWEGGETLLVERRRPHATSAGKILHMHRAR